MTVQVQRFQTPKNGSTSQDCQDAVAWSENKNTFAIADGVSDSAFQSLWANLLVKSFVTKAQGQQSFTKDWLAAWLQAEQSEWNSQVNWQNIPWHGRLKAQQTGAQATFLGIRLLPESRSWVGIAMGDCNLFRFGEDGAFKESVPNQHASDFSNATQAFSSIQQSKDQMLSQVKMIHGSYAPGDYLVLATDALARWILERLEEGSHPLHELPASDESGTFDRWVRAQRQDGRLKDDDTSVLMIQPELVSVTVPATGEQPAAGPRRKLAPPQPQPVPTPLWPRVASRVWIYVYLTGLLLCLIAGFWMGSAWQNVQNSKRIESDVQAPLLEWVRRLEAGPQVSVKELQKGLLDIIVAAQPSTETGRAVKQVICRLFSTEPACRLTPTPGQGVLPSR